MRKNNSSSSLYTIIPTTYIMTGRGGRLRKRGGQVVSFAPQMLDLCAGASRVALGGLLVLGGVFAATPDAMAGTCSPSTTSICSGPADESGADQPLSLFRPGVEISVTTTSGFGLNASSAINDAVYLVGSNITFTDNHASSITGAASALAIHNDSGSATVTSTGSLTGVNGFGLSIVNNAFALDISVEVNDVTGHLSGIQAVNNGTGDTSVTATGTVTSRSGDGVNVYGGPYSNDIDVTVVDVDARNHGISVSNEGTGTTTITASGTIDANNIGIYASTDENSKDVTVDVNTINGGYGAIALNVGGTGDIVINAAGALDTTNGSAIIVRSGGSTDTLTITTNGTVSGATGINVDHGGGGLLTINNSESITGRTDRGIVALQRADGGVQIEVADVSAMNTAIGVTNNGSGDTSITTTGTITSTNTSGIAVQSNGTGNTIIETVDINAANGLAISVSQNSGNLDITSTGTLIGRFGVYAVNGAQADSISIAVNDVEATTTGIAVGHSGTGGIEITASGDITVAEGSYSGIGITVSSNSAGPISISANNISSDKQAIEIASIGTSQITVDTVGLIESANSDGILIRSRGTAVEVNAHDIKAGVGQAGDGIRVDQYGNGDVVISVDTIDAGSNGIRISQHGTGDVNITSTDTITAGSDGINIFANNGAGSINVDVHNITADDSAINIINFGPEDVDITISGIVEGGDAAIKVDSNFHITATSIQNDGTIRNSDQLSTSHAINISGGAANIVNNGIIAGAITTHNFSDNFQNNGTWDNAGSTNDFGMGDDRLTNGVTGIIIAAKDASTAEVTTLNGLDNLVNNGLITLADGGAGDVFRTDGNATFNATSTLRVDVSAAGNSDLFQASGDIVLNNGKLEVNLLGALPTIGTQYTVLQGDSITGSFNFADQYHTAFLGLRDSHTANSVVLNFTQLRALSSVGLTPNQISTADALDSLPITNSLLTSLLYLGTDAEAQSAFNQLSGEVHPGVRTALAEDSRLPRSAVLDRLSNQDGGSIWGHLFWNTGDSDGNKNTPALKRETWGFIAGADVALGENAVIGVSGAYLTNDLDQRQRTSDGKLETIHVLGYVGAQAGQFRIKAGAGYAWGDVETTRNVSFTGFSDRLTAGYDATLFQAFAEAGVQLPVGGGYIEPIAQIAFLSAKTDGFTENGGRAALKAQRETEKSTISTIGARFSTPQSGSVSLGGMVGWQHSYQSRDPRTRFTFAGSDSFSVAGAPQSRDAAVANIEARLQLSPGSSIGLGYDGALGTSSQDHAAKLNFRFAF